MTLLLRRAWLVPAVLSGLVGLPNCSSLSCGEGTVERAGQCVRVEEDEVIDDFGFEGARGAAPASTTSILVAWLPVEHPEVTYNVYLATSEDGFNFTAPQATAPAGASTAVLGGLEEETTYYAIVRAALGDVEAPNDAIVSATTADDRQGPRFAGVQAAESAPGAAVELSWEPATDDLTPAEALLYFVFAGPSADDIDLNTPVGVSLPGATETRVVLPQPDTTYFFTVQARDAAGNFDGNEKLIEAVSGKDEEAPRFGGCKSALGRTATSLLVSWDPATDDIVQPQAITYNVYASETVDGFNFLAPDARVTGETSVIVPGLDKDTTYFVVCRAEDPSGNEDDNLRLQTAKTKDDDVPPEFGGVIAVENITPTTVDLTWAEATDNQTRTQDIVYDVFVSKQSEDFDFEGEPWMTSEPGATGITVESLDSNSTYFIVVLARDEGDNRSEAEGAAIVVTKVSFQIDVLGIFASKQCTACHGGAAPIADLSLAASVAYDELVGVDAGTVLGAGYKRVDPGNPEESHLIHRLAGTGPLEPLDPADQQFARMPQDGNYLSAAQLAAIELWITQGAENN